MLILTASRIGVPYYELADLDILSFHALVDRSMRAHYSERSEWLSHVRCAIHGDKGDWKKLTKTLDKVAGRKQPMGNEADFLRDMGLAAGGRVGGKF